MPVVPPLAVDSAHVRPLLHPDLQAASGEEHVMDVWCEICGKRWDSRDPAVRYWYIGDEWACDDESACFDRRSAQRAGESVMFR
jgi:hypothetical protein